MSSEEGIKEYKIHSKTVEAHNETFKKIYYYDNITTWIKKSPELDV